MTAPSGALITTIRSSRCGACLAIHQATTPPQSWPTRQACSWPASSHRAVMRHPFSLPQGVVDTTIQAHYNRAHRSFLSDPWRSFLILSQARGCYDAHAYRPLLTTFGHAAPPSHILPAAEASAPDAHLSSSAKERPGALRPRLLCFRVSPVVRALREQPPTERQP